MTSVDVILVNRNSGDMLPRCLRSLAAADRTGFTLERVCVVDDRSRDGSAERIETESLPLVVLHNERRLGYGASCNRGAAGSRADLLLFLNTDIEVDRDTLRAAVGWLERPDAAGVGMLGIQLRELDGSIARSSSRCPTLGMLFGGILGLDKAGLTRSLQMAEWDHLATREVDQVMGAFLLMRRGLFEAVGGYDERFFVYMEDLDLVMRAHATGARSIFLASAGALHLGGGTSRRAWAESLFFAARSRIQFVFKHWGKVAGMLFALASLFVEPWTRTLLYVMRGSPADAKASVTAYARLWGWVLAGAPPARAD